MADAEGGFLPPMPLSPPASTASEQVLSLPASRRAPLKPGGIKESNLVSYIDDRLMEVSGKYERRVYADAASRTGSVQSNMRSTQGYRDFEELALDVDQIFDVVWVSGTPSLQIPYLLNIALSLAEYLRSFPLAPRRLFPLLHKLDLAFASLMRGYNVESREPLPDAGARRLTITEKVRLRSVVESTRLAVIAASAKREDPDGQDGDATGAESTAYETDTDMTDSGQDRGRDWEDFDMETARVYELSIDELGKSLDSGPVSSYAEMDS